MNDVPERIYISPNTSNPYAGMWLDRPLRDNTIEYIRADLAQPAPVPVDDIRLVCGYARAWGDCDVYPRVLAWLDSQRTDADGSDDA